MKVDVQEISTTIKKINIEIPFEVVKTETDSCFQKLAKTVKVAGFRKGKIPRALLVDRYGDSVKNDVLQKLIPETLSNVIKEQNLRAITQPLVEEIKMENNEPLFFSAVIEVLPELKLKDFSFLELNQEIVKVSDKDVNGVIEYLRESYAVMESAGNKEIEDGDYILFDLKGYVDGKLSQEISGENKSMIVGKKVYLDEIENSVIGKKQSEEIKTSAQFAENFHMREFAGKKAEFIVKIIEIKQRKLPEVDQVFLNQVGRGTTLDELKKNIREELEEHNRLEGLIRLRKLFLDKLIDMNQVDVPPSLRKAETERLIKETQRQMGKAKTNDQTLELSAELMDEISTAAERSLKGEQIIDHYTVKKSITVSENELDLEIKKIAESIGQNPQVLKRNFSKDHALTNLRLRLLNEKTLDGMLKSVKVVDVFIDEIST